MSDIDLSPEEIANVNRAMRGEAVDLGEAELAALHQYAAQHRAAKSKTAGTPEAPSSAASALQGFGHNASMGFLDELRGAFGGLGTGAVRAATHLGLPEDAAQDAAYNLTGQRELPQGMGDALRSGYVANRNESRREEEAAKAAHPWAHGAGGVAGAIAGGFALPGGAAGGALPTVRQLATQGALGGLISSAGNSNADLVDDVGAQDNGGAGRLAGDALGGGRVGSVAGPLVGKASQALPGLLKRLANANAIRAVGFRPGITNMAKSINRDTAEEMRALGETALNTPGLIRPGGTPEGVQVRADKLMTGKYWPAITKTLDDATAAGGGLDTEAAAQSIQSRLLGTLNPTELRHAGMARDFVGDLAQLAPQTGRIAGQKVPLGEVNALKGTMYEAIPTAYQSQGPDLPRRLAKETVSDVRQAIENNVEQSLGPAAAAKLKADNEVYGAMKDIRKLSTNEETRAMAENTGGKRLEKWIMGAAIPAAAGAHMSGHTKTGLGALAALAAGREVMRRYPSTMAVGQNLASKALAPVLPASSGAIGREAAESLAQWMDEPSATDKAKARAKALRGR